MQVGYLLKGGFICKKCLGDPNKCDPMAVPVFTENIGRYSQTCPVCETVIIKGPFNCELFGPARDPRVFGREDMETLKNRLSEALACDDQEDYESIRRAIYERVLRAIMADKLQDRGDVFETLKEIVQ